MNSGHPLHVGRFPPPVHVLGAPGHGGTEGGGAGGAGAGAGAGAGGAGAGGDVMPGDQEVMELGNDAEPPVRCIYMYIHACISDYYPCHILTTHVHVHASV